MNKFNNLTGLGDVNRTSRFRSPLIGSHVLSLLILRPRVGVTEDEAEREKICEAWGSLANHTSTLVPVSESSVLIIANGCSAESHQRDSALLVLLDGNSLRLDIIPRRPKIGTYLTAAEI